MQAQDTTGQGEAMDGNNNNLEDDFNQVIDVEEGDAPMDEDSDGGEDAANDDDGEGQFHDTSIAAFYEHRDAVFCLQLHPRFPQVPIAFSGGADDKGRLWDTRTGASLAELGGHEDSVVAGGFSASGKFVATGGLDGRIRVWKLQAPASNDAPFAPAEVGADPGQAWGQCEYSLEVDAADEVVWISWHPVGNVFVAGTSSGTVWMWNANTGDVMNVFAGHTAAVTRGTFTPDGKRIVTASEDGSLIVWDPREATALSKIQPGDARFNMGTGITSLAISPDSKLAVVGGATGALRVVNLSNIDEGGAALVVSVLIGHDEGGSIESVSFIDLLGAPGVARVTTSGFIVSVSTDGKTIVWDLSTAKVRCEAYVGEPITDLVVHGAGPLYTTASADGKVITWDARNANHIAVHAGFADAVLNVVAGPDDGYTQGAETGGVGAYVNLEGTRGWKVVAAGDEGVALVFRV